MPTINDRIQRLRGGMSQKQFAIILDTRQQYIDRYETPGKKVPSGFLEKIKEKYPNQFEWLLTGKEPQETQKNVKIGKGDCQECEKWYEKWLAEHDAATEWRTKFQLKEAECSKYLLMLLQSEHPERVVEAHKHKAARKGITASMQQGGQDGEKAPDEVARSAL